MHEIISLHRRKATSLSYDLASQMLSDQSFIVISEKTNLIFTLKLWQQWVQTAFCNSLNQLFTYDVLLRGEYICKYCTKQRNISTKQHVEDNYIPSYATA